MKMTGCVPSYCTCASREPQWRVLLGRTDPPRYSLYAYVCGKCLGGGVGTHIAVLREAGSGRHVFSFCIHLLYLVFMLFCLLADFLSTFFLQGHGLVFFGSRSACGVGKCVEQKILARARELRDEASSNRWISISSYS